MRLPFLRSRRERAPAPFVVGVGRSGTTLLRLMLDTHPDLAMPPETGFIPDLIAAAHEADASADDLLQAVTSHRKWGDFGIEPSELRARWAALDPIRARGAVRAFYELYAEKQGKPRWGDKTPGYTMHMRRIAQTLPEARFIHVIRDGRAVAHSRMTSLSLQPVPMKQVARRWRKRLSRARRQGARLDHYLEIRYEDLVTDTEAVLRTVCEFIELDWDPDMLSYHRRSEERLAELDRDIPAWEGKLARSAESRMALHEQTTKPPDPARIDRWRSEMGAEDLATFEDVAGELLTELGYELAASAPAVSPAAIEPGGSAGAPIVLIIGLQKSGTSLLMRLLLGLDEFTNPLRWEGREYWGDDPPFSPSAFPAGTFYQRDSGERGHELGAAEATPEVVAHLEQGLPAEETRALVLKNPYNTVRVPWLRAAFPDAHIVGIVRRPLPNVFSLLKKHAENEHLHRSPEEGWWGVKPAGWRELADDDKLVQAARQWEAVNRRLWADRDEVDQLVLYHELCADPAAALGELTAAVLGREVEAELPELEALDSEHERGGLLESANRVFKRTKSLELNGAERAGERMAALDDAQHRTVLEICGGLAAELGLDSD
jgi:hypothetical protein